MDIMINKMFMTLLIWILRLVDGIFNMFRVLAGIDEVNLADGTSTSGGLVNYFLQSAPVMQVFISIFLLSIFICMVCVIAAVIKNIVNLSGGEVKSNAKVAGQGLSSVFVTLLMGFVLVTGMALSNQFLYMVNQSFNTGDTEVSLAATIIELSVETTYEIERIDEVYNDAGELVSSQIIYKTDEEGNLISKGGWIEDKSIADIDIQTDTADTIFGTYKKNLLGFEKLTALPPREAKIDIRAFNMLVAYFGAVALIVTATISCLGLIKRLYDIVFLALALPLVSATIPLDDGAKFKLWRETIISKVVLAYGAIISINIFIIMMPLVLGINYLSFGTLVGTVFKLMMLVGGALFVNGGQLLFARLVGASAEENREMMQGARALVAGGATAAGVARTAKNMSIGGRSKYGVERKGVVNMAQGAVNGVGGLIGGDSYRNWAGVSQTSQNSGIESALKASSKITAGAAYSSGGIVGVVRSGIKESSDAKKAAKNLDFAHFAGEQHRKGVMLLPPAPKRKKNT